MAFWFRGCLIQSQWKSIFFTLVFLIKYFVHISNRQHLIISIYSLMDTAFFFALLSKYKQMADVRNTCDKHTFAFTLEIIYGGLHNLVWSFVFSFIWTIFDRICSHMCGCHLCLPWQQINAHNGWVAWEKNVLYRVNNIFLITIPPRIRVFFLKPTVINT